MTKLRYISPDDVRIKYDVDDNLLIDMSGEEGGENIQINISPATYDFYRDDNGEIDLQEMWANIYNSMIDMLTEEEV